MHSWECYHYFFSWGHLCKAVRHPSWNILVIIFIWIDKGHIVINSVKNIWILIMANSRNVDLTGKQHSRHQQFWRFPWSPLEASSRLPRSRDHLFSHSMSKASLPQGPDMRYLTFYENKVPILVYTKPQSPTPFISNSHTSHFCTKLWSKTLIVLERISNFHAPRWRWRCMKICFSFKGKKWLMNVMNTVKV